MSDVSITYAKAHLGELVKRAAGGEAVCITRRGKPVARLVSMNAPRKPIDVERLRAVTRNMTLQTENSGDFVRRMRDEDRY
jgi:prevent-host-death family protein